MRVHPAEESTIPIRVGRDTGAATVSENANGIATTRKSEWSGQESEVTRRTGTIRRLLWDTIRGRAGTR